MHALTRALPWAGVCSGTKHDISTVSKDGSARAPPTLNPHRLAQVQILRALMCYGTVYGTVNCPLRIHFGFGYAQERPRKNQVRSVWLSSPRAPPTAPRPTSHASLFRAPHVLISCCEICRVNTSLSPQHANERRGVYSTAVKLCGRERQETTSFVFNQLVDRPFTHSHWHSHSHIRGQFGRATCLR